MAQSPRMTEPTKRRFEWRTIKIPLSLLQITIIFIVIVIGGVLGYRYRKHIPMPKLGLAGVVRIIFDKLGLSGELGESAGEGGGQAVVEQRFAVLGFTSGEVKIQKSKDLDWVVATPKMKLAAGDRVRTFGGARAEVVFDDGSSLRIKPDSLIIIGDMMENVKTKVRQSSVKLMVSSIEADIKKAVVEGSKFRLEMPTAVAEMGRAKIAVDVGPGQDSTLKVFTGNVAVAAGRRTLAVNELSQVSINAAQELSPVAQIMPAPNFQSPKNLTSLVFRTQAETAVPVQWSAVPRAASYHLQVDGDRRFPKPTVNLTGLRATEYRVGNLPPGIFFVRVAAVDAAGSAGDWAEPRVFRLILDKSPPEVTVTKFVSSRAPSGIDIVVEGATEPAVELSVAGRPLVVDDQGRFMGSIRGFPPREREIFLVAKDGAGNETRLPLSVSGGGR